MIKIVIDTKGADKGVQTIVEGVSFALKNSARSAIFW